MEEELDEIARGERDWVPLLRAFYGPLRDRVDEVRKNTQARATSRPRRPTRSAREGHPMVIRLGRNGRFLACSLYPEHKESRPLPGDEPPPQAGRGRGLPAVRRGDARRQARPVRAVRRLLALPGLQLHQEGGPAAAGSARRSRSSARRTTTATSSRVARGGPATSSGAARTTRSATSRRTSSRSGRSTTPTTGPVAQQAARPGSA